MSDEFRDGTGRLQGRGRDYRELDASVRRITNGKLRRQFTDGLREGGGARVFDHFRRRRIFDGTVKNISR